MKKLLDLILVGIFLYFIAGSIIGINLNAAQGRGDNIVEVIHDKDAVSPGYEKVFKLFKNELTRVLNENPGLVFGRHLILVAELVNEKKPDDVRFFILLGGTKEPVVIHWDRANHLKSDKAIRAFIEAAAWKALKVLCEESILSGGKPLRINPPAYVDL